MKYVIWRGSAIAGFLLMTSCAGFAVTLGPVRGNVLVGRSLDLTIPARLDRGEDPAALCIEAELAYSDTRIDTRRLTVVVTLAGEAGQANIRVTSPAIVDEPVVSLSVRAGCSVKNLRRYVLLADLPVDVAERAVPLETTPGGVRGGGRGFSDATRLNVFPAAPGGDTSASVAGADGSAAGVRKGQVVPRRARVDPSNRRESARLETPASPAGAGGALAPSQRLGESTSGTPRLRLDSADLPAEISPNLKSSAQLQAIPAESDVRRSEFAALWRALNLRPDDIARDLQKLDEVQMQATNLRDANTKSQTELGLAREKLKKAEAERFANPLVYALLALLALLLLSAAYLFSRSKRASRTGNDAAWWDKRDADRPGRKDVRELRDLMDGSPLDVASGSSPTRTEQVSRGRMADGTFQPGLRAGDSNYPASGMPGSQRGVNVNELFDIAQQADFFVSLGQHDHAIEVLSNHIRENAQTSPLAYLDLFKLFHELDRKPQYDELRTEFNRIFNAEIPPFEAFRQRGEGLEAYEGAMTRIQSLWNTPQVLEVIEESIFRKPGRPADAFGLEAYRELLLLYAMAHELVDTPGDLLRDASNNGRATATASGRDISPDYSLTELQPLGASLSSGRPGLMTPTMPAELETGSAGHVALDINLSEPWLNPGDADSDATVVLKAREPGAFQPSGSAWLDFDLSQAEHGEPERQDAAQGTVGTSQNGGDSRP